MAATPAAETQREEGDEVTRGAPASRDPALLRAEASAEPTHETHGQSQAGWLYQ